MSKKMQLIALLATAVCIVGALGLFSLLNASAHPIAPGGQADTASGGTNGSSDLDVQKAENPASQPAPIPPIDPGAHKPGTSNPIKDESGPTEDQAPPGEGKEKPVVPNPVKNESGPSEDQPLPAGQGPVYPGDHTGGPGAQSTAAKAAAAAKAVATAAAKAATALAIDAKLSAAAKAAAAAANPQGKNPPPGGNTGGPAGNPPPVQCHDLGRWTMSTNDIMNQKDCLTAVDNKSPYEPVAKLVLTDTGDLVEYQLSSGLIIWDAGIGGRGIQSAGMQKDGNFVCYDGANSTGNAVWNTGTSGNPGAQLQVQYDGNVVIYAANGNGPALWASHSSLGATATH